MNMASCSYQRESDYYQWGRSTMTAVVSGDTFFLAFMQFKKDEVGKIQLELKGKITVCITLLPFIVL